MGVEPTSIQLRLTRLEGEDDTGPWYPMLDSNQPPLR